MSLFYARYRLIALIWSLVFFFAGLSFLFFPEWVGEMLETIGGWFGLSGELVAEGGTIWHVLSLSLMSAIICLALLSSLYPEEKGYYLSLMVAKIVSTLGFLMLIGDGSIWFLCAVTDAFVALTLFYARYLDNKDTRYDFIARYLKKHSVSDEEIQHYYKEAATRPYYIYLTWTLSIHLLTWLGPYFVLRRFVPFSKLDDKSFDEFCKSLSHHPNKIWRSAWIVALQPAFGLISKQYAAESP
jgi:hypothetical protein